MFLLVKNQNTYTWSSSDNSIGKQEQIQTNLLKYVFENSYDLQSQHILSNVISYFKYRGLP